MAYDVSKMADWQIAEAAEEHMPTPEEWQEKLGLKKEEVLAYGKVAKLDFLKIMERLKGKPDGKYIEVTAVTPTPLGEGKTTTTMGLMEGLGKQGENVGGCIRQPSGGPTMNVKGTAAGGGAQNILDTYLMKKMGLFDTPTTGGGNLGTPAGSLYGTGLYDW